MLTSKYILKGETIGCDILLQGGLKAVVWTDTIQTVMMFGAVIVIVILGTNRVGGVAEVWKRNFDTGRIEFFK